ncbi:MAG TPA: histidine phosphatase family protein [Bryobacteraceae bacterium]|nr:histidine phosphatase family protein [Bryobacteraceae bacterium]
MTQQLWLVRHGETEWSKSGAHTGRTDLPLTDAGRENATAIRGLLGGRRFAMVLTSPMQRARDTCALAGYGDQAEVDPNLCEWDYGDYEGRTTLDIRKELPDWSLWVNGVPNGETIDQVATRADSVIARALQVDGDVALFAHGHILRILASRWVGLAPQTGRFLALTTASVSNLGYERATRVITRWNLSISG